MMSTNAIQVKFLLNQASLSERFNTINKTMDANPQGNTRKVEGFVVDVAIAVCFVEQEGRIFLE